jgi:hypothetical protein
MYAAFARARGAALSTSSRAPPLRARAGARAPPLPRAPSASAAPAAASAEASAEASLRARDFASALLDVEIALRAAALRHRSGLGAEHATIPVSEGLLAAGALMRGDAWALTVTTNRP